MSKMLNAEVTIKFRMNDVCRKEDLDDITFQDMVKWLIKEEGLCSLINEKDCKIINIKEV